LACERAKYVSFVETCGFENHKDLFPFNNNINNNNNTSYVWKVVSSSELSALARNVPAVSGASIKAFQSEWQDQGWR